MATAIEIRALLEDGPELDAQLAEWLEMKLRPLVLLLEQMQIPACERCGRRFWPSASGKARFCSSECEFVDPLPLGVLAAKRPGSSPQRRDDPEFEIVWNGVGPLPGAGGAAGLGSTLSGTRFSIGRRV